MKKRLAVVLALSLALSPLSAAGARAAETAAEADTAAVVTIEEDKETAAEEEPGGTETATDAVTTDDAATSGETSGSGNTDDGDAVDTGDAGTGTIDDGSTAGVTGENASDGATDGGASTDTSDDATAGLTNEIAAEVEPEEVATDNELKMSGYVVDQDDNGNVLHYYVDGEMVTGAWAQITLNGKKYKFYFDENGNPMVGMKKADGYVRYFADSNYPNIPRGAMLTGFRILNGYKYYFDSKGIRKTGFQVLGGRTYYLVDSRYPKGKWATVLKGLRHINGKSYYFNSYGAMKTGWCKVNGLMAYFTSKGPAGAIGWRKKDNKWFYMQKNGVAKAGWLTLGSDRYYLDKTKGGRMLVGPSLVGNTRYFFDSEGRLATSQGWKYYNGYYYYTYSEGKVATATTVDGYSVNKQGKASLDSMDWKAQNYSSNTNYLILVNRSIHKVSIYRRSGGIWCPLKKVYCGDGKASTPTIEGSFSVGIRMLYFDSGSARCWYATQFCGNYLFHSVLYYQNSSPSSVMDGRVGVGVSHGCVRLQIDNARWIYNNIPRGTRVIVYH